MERHKWKQIMKTSDFLLIDGDRVSGVMKDEAARKLIKRRKIKEVKLEFMFRDEDGKEFFAISHDHVYIGGGWAYPVKYIRLQLKPLNIPLIRSKLRFYTDPDEPFPLIIMKDGCPNAIIVAPAIWTF